MEYKKRMWLYGLASMMVTICISGFGRMAYGILMPYMKDSLSLSYKQAGMLGTSTALGYMGMVLAVGIMAAKWGSKRLVVSGLFLLAAGLFLLYAVQHYYSALIGMVILGIGTAFGYTPLVNIVVGWFPQSRGLMIGLLLSGMGLGTLIASLLAPIFSFWFQDSGWRFLWAFFGIVSIGAGIIAMKALEDPPIVSDGRRGEKASLFREVYVHKGVLLVAAIYGLIGFAYLIPQSFLFSYILEAGITEQTAGKIMAAGGVMSIFSGPVWGAISDRIGRKPSLCVTLFIAGISVILPIYFPSGLGFAASQVLWGFTYVGMLSLSQALSTEQTYQSHAPVALGYVTIYFAGGQILGPGLGGWMIDYMGGIPAALWLCFGLLASALLLSATLSGNRSFESAEAVPKSPTEKISNK